MTRLKRIWPEGVRTVVVLTFLVESWSEGKAPPYSPMTSPPRPGTKDLAGITWSEYGARAGADRLMRIARERNLPATFCVNARVAELFPGVIQRIVANGFELAGHNYAQDEVLPGLDEAEERALIARSLGILEDVSGVKPRGWLSSTIATTERTTDLLAEAGMLWHGDYNYLDLPCRLPNGGGGMVAIPHSDFADNRVLRAAPRDFFQCYKDTFDYLHNKEPDAFMNITVHGHFGGRPLISAVLDEVLGYITSHEGVWMPRHDELADWINENQVDEISYAERFPLSPA
ncbi:chitin deacetylase [Pigmentiphaga litoralis]|uniref:polysaccharide deacetylase family protein n=1 Tax=Pigmentiphaga litoralis TaxID=516702 RepID=UPI00167B1E58|nr:polysaccharide deacetylase family protein [Pigmentiphaga litoralis]GGX32481.1 chitin deacetylase [Pigmentiphaga litoralis]